MNAYTTPLFEVVEQDESNKVFFATSGGSTPSVSASINSMTSTSGSW